MNTKQNESGLGAGPRSRAGDIPNLSLEGTGVVSEGMAVAADRTRAVLDASVKVLQSESAKFLDEFSSQSEVALEQMARCKSPFEVIAVQQGWMQARSLAYLQSGLRVAKTLATVSAAKKAKTEPHRSPPSPRSDGSDHEARRTTM